MISVVICTHNRAELLANALRSVCEQSIGPDRYEVIVVDNNSSDQTREVAESFFKAYRNVRYCQETQVGLSHARNRGWQEAQGEYVAYTDDDCEVPPEWLAVALEVIEAHHPGIFGGPYTAFYRAPKPKWYKDVYGESTLGSLARPLDEPDHLSGGNIFFASRVIETLGGFDPRLGMAGSQTGYGEEVALQRLFRARYPQALIYYEPRLCVRHLVKPEHMTLSWIMRAYIAKGRYRHWTSREADPQDSASRVVMSAKAAKVAFVFVAECARGLFSRDREQYPYYQNWVYERAAWRLAGLGRLQAELQDAMEK